MFFKWLEAQSKMVRDDKMQNNNPKIEVQYFGEESFMVDKILLKFNDDERKFSIEYNDKTERLVACFLSQSANSDENAPGSEYWALEKEDIQTGNIRFKIVIGQSLWRFQRIKKNVEVTEIRGIMRKITSNQIIYEYAAPLSEVSRIEIVNQPV